MTKVSVSQIIGRANAKLKKGEFLEAEKLFAEVLMSFPNNVKAQQGLRKLNSDPAAYLKGAPPQHLIDKMVGLINSEQLRLVITQANNLLVYYPKAVSLWNILGIASAQIGQFDQAIKAFERIITFTPNQASAYYNLGNVYKDKGLLQQAVEAYTKALELKPNYEEAYNNLIIASEIHEQDLEKKQIDVIEHYQQILIASAKVADKYFEAGLNHHKNGELTEAIDAYKKAIGQFPDYAEAYNNMGIALKDQGKLEEALEAYNKALAIKPDYADAYLNMGVSLTEQGKLEEAIQSYNKALAIKPDYASAIENSLSLAVQLLPIIANFGYEFNNCETQVNPEVLRRPKYKIHKAIKAYLEADFSHADSHINNFKACDQNLLGKLKPKDKTFCNAYSNFIGRLLDVTWDDQPDTNNKVYHLGESHCLSYAHRNIAIGGSNFRIAPRITFGAKAFHFSSIKHDSFKAITKAHFISLPKSSKVFLSYGEIDCRPNEGFISAATKLDKPLEKLIDQTTEGYVQWFLDQNAGQRHRLYFINVPAPVYNKKLTTDRNLKVARTVALFNAALKKYTRQHGFDLVDVFKFTAGKKGFSNGLFHVDKFHLGAKAIAEIEQQLS
jgi:tetratricopeptide (TPR) repeat protein